MGALLVAVAIMGIMLSVALPVWNQLAKREREAELVFRGEQYARAVELYQRTYAATYPEDVEELIEERFLRRVYRDPMTEDGEFRVVYEAEVQDLLQAAPTTAQPGQVSGRGPEDDAEEERGGADDPAEESDASDRRPRLELDDEPPRPGTRGGVVGVVSRSDEESLLIYKDGRKYSEWLFLYTPSTADPESAQPGGAPLDPGATPVLEFGSLPSATTR